MLGIALGMVCLGQASAAEEWLVRSTGTTPYVLWDDGSVTQQDLEADNQTGQKGTRAQKATKGKKSAKAKQATKGKKAKKGK